MKSILAKLTSKVNLVSALGYFVIAALAVAFIETPGNFMLVFLLACVFLIFQNRHFVNIVSLLSILLIVKTAELAILEFVRDTKSNYIIFSSFFLVDIPAIILIALRTPLCRMIEFKVRGQLEDPDKYIVTNADLIVGKIYITYCIINLLALLEHALRHLDHFGFPKDAPYTIYLYENFRLIWGHYELVKHSLNIVEFMAVFSTISNYMRSERMLKA